MPPREVIKQPNESVTKDGTLPTASESKTTIPSVSTKPALTSSGRKNAKKTLKIGQEVTEARNHHDKPPLHVVDKSRDLARTPGRLILHPLKIAPTLHDAENKIYRETQNTRVRFFGVPIKIYEEFNSGQPVDLLKMKFTKDDRDDLDRYGSRVIMNQRGRVVALEVDETILEKKTDRACLDCGDHDHVFSETLRNDRKTRKCFMAKVLIIETVFKAPIIPVLWYQCHSQVLHDFTFQELYLFLVVSAILRLTRVATLFFAHVGHNEPCRSIISFLTIIDNVVLASIATTLFQVISLIDEEYFVKRLAGISALDIRDYRSREGKSDRYEGTYISFPYSVALYICELCVVYLVLAVYSLIAPKKASELGNFFLIIVFLCSILCSVLAYVCVFPLDVFDKRANSWDIVQILVAAIATNMWTMWRYYYLQQVVLGRVMKIDEKSAQYVASSFAMGCYC